MAGFHVVQKLLLFAGVSKCLERVTKLRLHWSILDVFSDHFDECVELELGLFSRVLTLVHPRVVLCKRIWSNQTKVK
jgi:hypothetical protein